jgi:hypothetical protein
MIQMCVTRFNNKTFIENENYRREKNIKGCIYPIPAKIGPNIPLESTLIVFEMNNETNKIIGIGLIKNYLRLDKYFKVYSEGNYNRYTYRSPYRLDREDFVEEETEFCEEMETILFKGKDHIKRGRGIQLIPSKKLLNSKFKENTFLEFTSQMFITRYTRA